MRLRIALVFLVAGPLAGCGEGAQYASVSGRVTLDGKPLANAVVSFLPVAADGGVEAPGPGSMAVTDGNGVYALRAIGEDRPGAVVGEHRVQVSTRALVGDGAAGIERVPARYNTNTVLTFAVPADGSAAADFALKSR